MRSTLPGSTRSCSPLAPSATCRTARGRRKELLTLANSVLGFSQASLAKYLLIAAREDREDLDADDEPDFFNHVLSRARMERDLHFQTRTTIDTLDYSGTGLNAGSKLVIAAAGDPVRTLGTTLPQGRWLPEGWGAAALVRPGIVAIEAPSYESSPDAATSLGEYLADHPELGRPETPWPLLVLTEDAEFVADSFANFLWVTFTRSNPSHDGQGVGSFTEHKHWGCKGSLIVDARRKPHHAPPLEEPPEVARAAETLAGPRRPPPQRLLASARRPRGSIRVYARVSSLAGGPPSPVDRRCAIVDDRKRPVRGRAVQTQTRPTSVEPGGR